MAQLTLENISKSFAATSAVDRINLTVDAGEFIALVGPSGCGKSTILRMIAGLEAPTSGRIILDGRDITEVAPKERDIAMVFQNYALYPHMTVFENMAFALKMNKTPKALIKERVEKAARVLGLTDLLPRKSKALSGGQQQRVAVGRAIVRDPKIFLFDEPLSNLDAKLRVAMRAELIKLHKRLKATMIYVTHDQVEAMSMGTRLVVLKDGKIQQSGPPLTVYNEPANRFVAGFIGSPPMNFFEVELGHDQKEIFLQLGKTKFSLTREQQQSLSSAQLPASTVILGIRPEDFIELPYAKDPSKTVRVVIDFVEPLGNETLATCRLAGTSCILRLPPHFALPGNEVCEFAVSPERIKLFHPKSGEVIN
jgi:multiple sugar transport system ATP-binding protein